MDGSSFPDFIPQTTRSHTAAAGIVLGVALSSLLWAAIGAVVWLAYLR